MPDNAEYARRLSVSWFCPQYDHPDVPYVTEVVDMPDGERSIKVYDTNESLIRMWLEIERLYALIDGADDAR
jgi:hypothetical protein